jgi:hypothetical protein
MEGAMAQLTYLDFDLLIEREQEEYKARIIDSPTGQATSVFSLPSSKTDLNARLLWLTNLQLS